MLSHESLFASTAHSVIQSDAEYLISFFSRNLSPSGLEMAGGRVCIGCQQSLTRHPNLLSLQVIWSQSSGNEDFWEEIGV